MFCKQCGRWEHGYGPGCSRCGDDAETGEFLCEGCGHVFDAEDMAEDVDCPTCPHCGSTDIDTDESEEEIYEEFNSDDVMGMTQDEEGNWGYDNDEEDW